MYFTYERPKFDVNDPEEIRRVIREAYENGLESARSGEGRPADYIPELAKADAGDFGICVRSIDGETISHVQMEPSGDEFNSILKLDTVSALPFNPMINAGAIQVASMLSNIMDFDDMLAFARAFCMDDAITLNEAVYRSESETGDRNRAIAYLLKSKGILQGEPDKTLDLYFKMCSLNVNADSLARMGLLLANGGAYPFTGRHLLHPGYIRTIRSLMYTCGLYNESGAYGVLVGIPSKSGVGGGITAAVSGRWGIGTYGPALNAKGNSVGGLAALQHLSHLLRLNMFE